MRLCQGSKGPRIFDRTWTALNTATIAQMYMGSRRIQSYIAVAWVCFSPAGQSQAYAYLKNLGVPLAQNYMSVMAGAQPTC